MVGGRSRGTGTVRVGGAELSGTGLSGAVLSGAVLSGTVLSGAVLGDVPVSVFQSIGPLAARAAPANSAALAKRSAGCFAMARLISARTGGGTSSGSGSGSSSRWRSATCSALSPSNGGRPAMQWYATAPSA